MIWKELWRAWDNLTTTDLDEKVGGRIAGSIQTPDTSILTSSFVLNNQAEQKRKREDWFAPKGPASRGLGGIRNTQDASDMTMGIDIKLLMMMRSMNEGGVGVTLYLKIWPRHLFWKGFRLLLLKGTRMPHDSYGSLDDSSSTVSVGRLCLYPEVCFQSLGALVWWTRREN